MTMSALISNIHTVHVSFTSCSDLVARDNEMVQSKKALDSDMQMLVYENYNKVS